MTTLESRRNTALLIVDMQVGVVAKAYGRDAVVKNLESAELECKSREKAAPPAGMELVFDHDPEAVERGMRSTVPMKRRSIPKFASIRPSLLPNRQPISSSTACWGEPQGRMRYFSPVRLALYAIITSRLSASVSEISWL